MDQLAPRKRPRRASTVIAAVAAAIAANVLHDYGPWWKTIAVAAAAGIAAALVLSLIASLRRKQPAP